jgi:hypothetical protein
MLLAFPAGRKPRFDQSHIAARGISSGFGFSGIPVGKTLINLLSGKPLTAGALNTGITDCVMGPVVNVGNSSTQGNVQMVLAGQSTSAIGNGTIAAIFSINAFDGVSQSLFMNSSGNNGLLFYINGGSSNQLSTYNGSAGVNSGLIPLLNTPYFAVASNNGTTTNFLLLNLLNGEVQTASPSGSTNGTPNGSYSVGWYSTFATAVDSKLAAIMYAPSYMTLSAIKQWAQDPWAFWYPNTQLVKPLGLVGGKEGTVHGISYLGTVHSTGASYGGSFNIGAASSNYIVVAISQQGGGPNTVNSVTVGGVSLNVDATNSAYGGVQICSGVVNLSGSQTITANMAQSPAQGAFFAYSLSGLLVSGPVAAKAGAWSNLPFSVTQSVLSHDIVIITGCGNTNGGLWVSTTQSPIANHADNNFAINVSAYWIIGATNSAFPITENANYFQSYALGVYR